MKDKAIVRNLPVAKFYYKGKHSHPVQRTVLLIDSSSKYLTGFELREGVNIRAFNEAPMKTFRKDRVAIVSQCRKRVRTRLPKTQHADTTLDRVSLLELIKDGP